MAECVCMGYVYKTSVGVCGFYCNIVEMLMGGESLARVTGEGLDEGEPLVSVITEFIHKALWKFYPAHFSTKKVVCKVIHSFIYSTSIC